MSEANGKVCCNCRHNIRSGKGANIVCHCEITKNWLSYLTVMTFWCRRWARDKTFDEVEHE